MPGPLVDVGEMLVFLLAGVCVLVCLSFSVLSVSSVVSVPESHGWGREDVRLPDRHSLAARSAGLGRPVRPVFFRRAGLKTGFGGHFL